MSACKKNILIIGLISFFCLVVLGSAVYRGWAEENENQNTKKGLKTEVNQANEKAIPLKAASLKSGTVDTAEKGNGESREESKTDIEDEQDLMEKALELLELADNFWKNGDIENTLNTLDKAYALILDTNGNVEIARQKDDLRLLISRRILALYSSQQTKTNGKASEIPLLMNADVEKEIRSFQGPEKEFFISSYYRSGLYRDMIVEELRKASVPEELFWLPLVESGFKLSALSRARALGLWQFIPSTGYKFGLTRDEWVDERMDIMKSTHAAIAYLKELHSMFGDWLTVLAAYNCGEGRVLRVISRQHINYFDRFWDLYSQLPNETARYVPRFLATLHIIKNPGKYGFEFQTATATLANYEIVKVDKMMKLSDIATKMEVPEDVIGMLNAELRYKITPNREYAFKIPQGSLQKFNLVYNEIPEAEKPRVVYEHSAYLRHRVRSGETVSTIAQKYHVSVRAVYDCNHMSRKQILPAGKVIRIPVRRVTSVKKKQKPSARKNINRISENQTYKVKNGDSLFSIGRKYDVSVARIKEMNNLKTNVIQVGTVLRITDEESGKVKEKKDQEITATKMPEKISLAGKTLTVKDVDELGLDKHIVTKGENLSIISRKYNIELAKLIEMNNLSEETLLTPGQILVIK